MIVVAVYEPDKTHDIVETVKKHFPHLEIVVRTRGWTDSYDILNLGVDHVFRETLDTSLRMGAEVLGRLGQRRYQVHRAVQSFRAHDDRYLKELAEMRDDRRALLRGARQRIADLEMLMTNDAERIGKDRDIGWDATTLIEEYGKQP